MDEDDALDQEGNSLEEDVDLSAFVDEEEADEEGVEGEDFVLPIHSEEDRNDADVAMGDYTIVNGGPDIDENGGCVDLFHKFIKLFLYPRGDGSVNNSEFDKWSHPIECLLALYHLKYDGTFKDANHTTGTFARVHYHIRGATLYEGLRKIKTGEFNGNAYEYVNFFFREPLLTPPSISQSR